MKRFNLIVKIMLVASFIITILGYFVPMSFPINVGLIGLIGLGISVLIIVGFAFMNMIKDMLDKTDKNKIEEI